MGWHLTGVSIYGAMRENIFYYNTKGTFEEK